MLHRKHVIQETCFSLLKNQETKKTGQARRRRGTKGDQRTKQTKID